MQSTCAMTKRLFCDLNIPSTSQCRQVCEHALSLGYHFLALSTAVVARNCLPQNGGGGKKGGKKRKLEERTGGVLSSSAAASSSSEVGVPPPKAPEWLNALKESHPHSRILQRLTIIFGDVADLQAVLSQPNTKLYDLIAIVPTNHDAMQNAIISTALVFDLISFDFEGPHWINKIRLNRQKGKVAAEKEINFELTYSPSFHGDEPLENMIYTANRLTEDICTRRIKNIVISSCASKPGELRSPKDVISLGYLLGLDETTSSFCIRDHPCRSIAKSDSRKYGKSWVAFIPHKNEMEPAI